MKKQLEKTIFIALGEASMCWEPIPSGVFESSRCQDVGNSAVKDVAEILSKQKNLDFGIKFLEWAAQYYQQSVKVNIWKVKGSRSKDRFTTTELLTIYKNQL